MNAKITFAEVLAGALNAGSMILNDYALSVVPTENGSKLVARRGSEVQELTVKNGESGPEGVGIASIIQTVLGMGGGAKNEWLITLTDGRTETITVYNGENGNPGKPGFSPTIEVVEGYDTINLIITDVNGTQTVTIPLIPPSIDVPDNESPGGSTSFTPDGETLVVENGVLRVNTTNDMEQDNTLPITSAGVYATVGNIEALLKTI